MGSCLVACCIMGSDTTSGRSPLIILLMPISSPWSITMSAISEVICAERGIGCHEVQLHGLLFRGKYFIVCWKS